MTSKRSRKKSSFDTSVFAKRLHTIVSRDLSRLASANAGKKDASTVYRYLQLRDLSKRLYDPARPDLDDLSRRCARDFVCINNHMYHTNLRLQEFLDYDVLSHRIRTSCRPSKLDLVLVRARNLTHSVLHDFFSFSEDFHGFRHTGGVTVGLKYATTNLEDKFSFPMSVTASALPYLHQCIRTDQILTVLGYGEHIKPSDMYRVVRGSRFTTVPKTIDKDRGIAIEPTGSLALQKDAEFRLIHALRSLGIRLKDQQFYHRKMVFESSITGRNSTLDLSEASNCLSLALCRFLLPPNVFSYLSAIRSPSIHLKEFGWVDLEMISTMGNAYTFPLETLVFSVLATSVVSTLRNNSRSLFVDYEDLKSVSVFGDDIICPTDAADTIIDVLEHLGFILNKDKSFYSKTFLYRESCGQDFLDARDVRPFMITGPIDLTPHSVEAFLYSTFNNLLKKYITCFGERDTAYMEAPHYVISVIAEVASEVLVVPDYFPEDAGLKISEDFFRYSSSAPSWSTIGFRETGYLDSRKNSTSFSSEKGQYHFKYLSYRFPDRRLSDHRIRYWASLRGNTEELWYLRKKGGSYVVKSAYTSCMTLNK